MDTRTHIESMIEQARIAQQELETYSQEQIDQLVKAIARTIFDHAAEISRLAVDETRMGRYEDKIAKHLGKARSVWWSLKGVKSRGIINYLPDTDVVEIAKPIGVIGSVTPATNPTVTAMHNAMCAIKTGNAIIISPHPRAKACSKLTVQLMVDAITALGAPADLIQIVEEPSVEASGYVMRLCDFCVSTGGPGMVKAAYSSGKPAYGVGAGNNQCLLDRDINIPDAVSKIITGRTYDNGILCTCEQCVICPEESLDEITGEFVKQGAYYVQESGEVSRLRAAMFPGGALNKDVVGLSPVKIAAMAGFEVPESTRLLLVKAETYGQEDCLSQEKLCPVACVYTYQTWKDAVEIARENLEVIGKGHSITVHSQNRDHVEYAANALCVARVTVNAIGSSSIGGAYQNGLAPTLTLGCGTWSGNSSTDNLTWKHFVNITRVAYFHPEIVPPSDEEIWA